MPDYNRKPTIWERIQMDLQHDVFNSKIKYWLIILSGLGLWALSWVIKLT